MLRTGCQDTLTTLFHQRRCGYIESDLKRTFIDQKRTFLSNRPVDKRGFPLFYIQEKKFYYRVSINRFSLSVPNDKGDLPVSAGGS